MCIIDLKLRRWRGIVKQRSYLRSDLTRGLLKLCNERSLTRPDIDFTQNNRSMPNELTLKLNWCKTTLLKRHSYILNTYLTLPFRKIMSFKQVCRLWIYYKTGSILNHLTIRRYFNIKTVLLILFIIHYNKMHFKGNIISLFS